MHAHASLCTEVPPMIVQKISGRFAVFKIEPCENTTDKKLKNF